MIIVGEYLRLLDRWGAHYVRSQLCAQMLAASHQRGSRERQKSGGGGSSATASANTLYVPPQIQLTCTFCNKNLTTTASGRPATMACPHCHKPLPRCALCRQHMGTTSSNDALQSTFTWCSSCRHGGHLKHMFDWFAHNIECPVAGCSCRCDMLD